MPYQIRRAAVIGAGTMGAAIAAVLANVGIPVDLLDVAPDRLTPEEEAQGLAVSDREVRNRIVSAGLARAKGSRPPSFVDDAAVDRVSVGNLADDFGVLANADWIVEVIVEQLQPKQDLMARIEAVRKPGTIVSSNTSGIPITSIGQGRGQEFRQHLVGTHFFNPPRYLRLLEVIPTADTLPEVTEFISRFAEETLDKGVVRCKDTPNFVANRLGSMWRAFDASYALEHGYTVEEVDALLGPLIGRPKTGVFRLADLVGLDVAMSVRKNLYPAIAHDETREILMRPSYVDLTEKMLSKNLLGLKSGGGFYKQVMRDGQREYHVLDLGTLEYRPAQPAHFASVDSAERLENLPERLRAVYVADDRAGRFLRASLGHNLAYAARRVPEIADSFAAIDDAARWGFNHELGPFELWDAIGVERAAKDMEQAGYAVAPWVNEMLAAGIPSFYQYADGARVGVYDLESKSYRLLRGG
ncbi:MAG: hypothetical protein HY329_19210 [Chloroflexi bacterium]|nr:hypothetical protein [Chloroflexota bacterium]